MPSNLTFDLDALRSFATGVELGSFAKAADRLARSTSAVSAHLKKLEAQVGTPLLRKAGRGLVPTPAGELLLAYARRLLALNDEASHAIRGTALSGEIRLGLQEDFGERLLPGVLSAFARVHPKVRIATRMARNGELLSALERNRLDLVLGFEADVKAARMRRLATLPMRWIGQASGEEVAEGRSSPLPLVTLDAPCVMRSAAIEALDQAGMAWRIAFTSASLAGVWAAVTAGLGVAVRTPLELPHGLAVIDEGLPRLPRIGLALYRNAGAGSTVVDALEERILAALGSLALGPGAVRRARPSFRPARPTA